MPPFPPLRSRILLSGFTRTSSTRMEAEVQVDGRRQRLWFETDGIPVEEAADAFLPVLVPAAMAAGLPLRIEAPVSADAVAGARRVAGVLAAWNPHWGQLLLECKGPKISVPERPEARGQATFFSGGLDSFRTLQHFRDQLSQLVFVHGFDIDLAEQAKADLVRSSLAEVAAEVGLSLLTVRTNLRAFTDRWVSWEQHQHGCALAAVALLLSPHLSTILIPSSRSLPFLHPYGSHPGLESLWSSEGLELRHDTLSEDRVDKLQELANWLTARRHLRVCWQPGTPGLNCGRCRKCLTNQALLRGFCGDQAWPTFPDRFDLRALAQVQPNSSHIFAAFLRLRHHLETTGRDPQLLAAVNLLLRRHARQGTVSTLRQRAVRALAWLRP